MNYFVIILLAVVVDLFIGEFEAITHPVVLIGRFISWGEEKLRRINKGQLIAKLAGLLLSLVTVGLTWLLTFGLVELSEKVSSWLGVVVELILLSMTLSITGLAEAAEEIYHHLIIEDLTTARQKLSYIVGRDTEQLSSSEVIRAVVETVAENTVDGILSPLFYAGLGGAPLAMAYKAVNTLDSMLGYRNQRYLHFGWAAARIDDLANLLPARIGGLLFTIAAFILGADGRQAGKIILRDAHKHPSPNGGYAEAAVAGALGVRLGGINYYQGVKSFRAYLGDKERELITSDIKRTIHLMYLTTLLFVGGMVVLTLI
ncbi:MAG: adenosylcobinamide-phosphate synthase CbiB [Bacillota bacterium]